MDGDERVGGEDADQVRVPPHADLLAEERERHRIERAADFDMAIGVDRALAAGEAWKGLGRERLQRQLLDLDEVRPDLAARGAVNPEPRDRPIPVPQERILGLEAVEPAPLERVALDVAATALLLPVFLRRPWRRRQGREAPVRSERQVDVVAVGIVEAGADDRGLQIVVAHDTRHAADVAKRALMEAEERLELLIPDRFLVAVAGMPEGQAKDPRSAPLARRPIERGRATEEIDLSFGAGSAMKHTDRTPRRRDRGRISAFANKIGRRRGPSDDVRAQSVAREQGVNDPGVA